MQPHDHTGPKETTMTHLAPVGMADRLPLSSLLQPRADSREADSTGTRWQADKILMVPGPSQYLQLESLDLFHKQTELHGLLN